ncbi:hypothetical protein EGI22_20335 [Lacihabitans sp. LS3-19]|nr:hypothetical protein [Lacihabitans sp. LS3-19]
MQYFGIYLLFSFFLKKIYIFIWFSNFCIKKNHHLSINFSLPKNNIIESKQFKDTNVLFVFILK